MSYLSNAGLFLLQVAAGLLVFLLLLRTLMRATHCPTHHPVVNLVAKFSKPLVSPFARFLPYHPRWDISAMTVAYLVQLTFFFLLVQWQTLDVSVASLMVLSLAEVLHTAFDMVFFLILIMVILNWVTTGHNHNTAIFDRMCEPFLTPFRRLIPNAGGFDLSPIFAMLAIKLVDILLVMPLQDWGHSL